MGTLVARDEKRNLDIHPEGTTSPSFRSTELETFPHLNCATDPRMVCVDCPISAKMAQGNQDRVFTVTNPSSMTSLSSVASSPPMLPVLLPPIFMNIGSFLIPNISSWCQSSYPPFLCDSLQSGQPTPSIFMWLHFQPLK